MKRLKSLQKVEVSATGLEPEPLSSWLGCVLSTYLHGAFDIHVTYAFQNEFTLYSCLNVFRTHASIYDEAFLGIYLTALYFRNISSIIDLRLGYIYVSENIEIFKGKLRWSKSSRLLQRIAIFVRYLNSARLIICLV